MKHEADGIYYVDVSMIEKLNPCSAWVSYITRACKRAPGGRAVVTLKALTRANYQTGHTAQVILSDCLREQGKINNSTQSRYDDAHWRSFGFAARARVTMDMLAHMARTQGLLA